MIEPDDPSDTDGGEWIVVELDALQINAVQHAPAPDPRGETYLRIRPGLRALGFPGGGDSVEGKVIRVVAEGLIVRRADNQEVALLSWSHGVEFHPEEGDLIVKEQPEAATADDPYLRASDLLLDVANLCIEGWNLSHTPDFNVFQNMLVFSEEFNTLLAVSVLLGFLGVKRSQFKSCHPDFI